MTASCGSSPSLGAAIADYSALKRALGRRFIAASWVLADVDRFVCARGADLTAQLFGDWCLSLERLHPNTRRDRMRIVRAFCLYRRRTVPGCFVPDAGTFPAKRPVKRPYIFGEQEILRLLRAAGELRPNANSPLNGESYRLAVVLLYTAGLRRGELVRLVVSDYDPGERTLLIRESKFHKSRLVALSEDAVGELEAYLRARRRFALGANAPLLVVSFHGLHAPSGDGLGGGIQRLFRRAGVLGADGRPPRVHDLRHTYAVHALLRWYRAGVDVQARLPALSIAMGHVSVVSTAYYLSLLDPVAEAASERFERQCAKFIAGLRVTGGA